MERRLQERCADLQREVFRLQGAHHQDGYKSLDKRPVALPRHVPPQGNNSHTSKTRASSEQDDEGISSSETGQSLSPEPILVLPQGNTQKYRIAVTSSEATTATTPRDEDEPNAASIEDVIEELANIVSDAERQISGTDTVSLSASDPGMQHQRRPAATTVGLEKEIVPVNLLPQPPRKSRSLAHLLSSASDFDGSDYEATALMRGGGGDDVNGGAMMVGGRHSYYDDLDYDQVNCKFGRRFSSGTFEANSLCAAPPPLSMQIGPDVVTNQGSSNLINSNGGNNSTNRDILNVIMDAREKDVGVHPGFLMRHQHHRPQPDRTESSVVADNGGGIIINGEMPAMSNNNMHSTVMLPLAPLAPPAPPPPQKFSGVFFMAEMSSAQKYPKPDVTAALEARRVTKNLDRMESYGNGLDSMIDIVLTETANKQLMMAANNNKAMPQNQILLTGSNTTRYVSGKSSGGGAGGGCNGSQLISRSGPHSNAGSKVTDLVSGLY